jgi:hypothetical protein
MSASVPAKAKELWDPNYQTWFPAGPTDPHLALIRVRVERAEYWDAPFSTWPLEAGFVVLGRDQQENPEYHARIVFERPPV